MICAVAISNFDPTTLAVASPPHLQGICELNPFLYYTYRDLCTNSHLHADDTDNRRYLSHGTQNSVLGTLQRLAADVDTGPVEKGTILFWSQCQDPHLGIAPQKKSVLDRILSFIHRHYENIGSRLQPHLRDAPVSRLLQPVLCPVGQQSWPL